jgi:Tfp pilus assembly protein PilV
MISGTASPAPTRGERERSLRRQTHSGLLRNSRAFTLVEVAVAAVVLAFGIAMSIVTIQAGYRTMDDARNLTIASQVLQSELERIRLLPWSSDTGGESITGLAASETVDLTASFTSNPQIAARFTLLREVAQTVGREATMRDITLTVSWTGFYGVSHSRTFTTRYCKDGLYDYYYTVAS